MPPTSGAGGRAEAIRREGDIARAATGRAFTLGVKGCTGSRHRLQGGAGGAGGDLGWREREAAGRGDLPGGHKRQRGAAAVDGVLGRAQRIAREAELHPGHIEGLIQLTAFRS